MTLRDGTRREVSCKYDAWIGRRGEGIFDKVAAAIKAHPLSPEDEQVRTDFLEVIRQGREDIWKDHYAKYPEARPPTPPVSALTPAQESNRELEDYARNASPDSGIS